MEKPDQFRELFRMQRALNQRIGVHTDTMTDEEKTKWVLNYCRAMSQEMAELTDSVPWKWWAKGIRSLHAGELMNGAFFSIFGLIFGGVGFGLWVGFFFASKGKKRTDAIKAAHPQKPWLWKDQWAGGCIRSSTKAAMATACVFALFWNLISMTVCAAVIPAELKKGNHKALFALLFPAVGIVLLVWAAREIIRWKKFGESVFKMLSVAGVMGGQFNGAIQTSVKIRPQNGFHLKLRCINRITTTSGKKSSTHEK